MLKTVVIPVRLIELMNVPGYEKMIKEAVTGKGRAESAKTAFLNAECSAVVLGTNDSPQKLGDPGSFLIFCTFTNDFSCDALADLGASINLMPYSMFLKLKLGELKPTNMTIRLADRSCQVPMGVAEDVLVFVGEFQFLVDFVILDMKADRRVPIILGRPFLYTADAIIRVKDRKISLGYKDLRINFSIDRTMTHSYSTDSECFSMEIVDYETGLE